MSFTSTAFLAFGYCSSNNHLISRNVDSESLMKMRNTRDSGKPDPTRTEAYIFRGCSLVKIGQWTLTVKT
ncbi:hypothetical protein [Sphaerochaeta pleomorpha]|uniref:hypothetical protein n=1 Tax=Sphaerochaeta pleomorpha TaxID=1131707 RepID=UPI0012DFA586|nr:hypothetical protein [Sphaerochaeta pleomorpha]